MKRIIILIFAAIAAIALAGCGGYGEAHNYNAAPPYGNIHAKWVRIESPYHYHNIIFTCVNTDGIYIDLADNNSVTVVTRDANCGPQGQILVTGISAQ